MPQDTTALAKDTVNLNSLEEKNAEIWVKFIYLCFFHKEAVILQTLP